MRLCALRLFSIAVAVAIVNAAASDGAAQTRVRTETIRPPAAEAKPPATGQPGSPATDTEAAKKSAPAGKPASRAAAAPAKKTEPAPEIISDLSVLPPAVARMRERILAAARSGSLEQVLTVMQTNETMPIFSFGDDKDPLVYWKANYPDSEGVEVLSILTEVLEASFVHVEKGKPQEMYLWPYFARMPLASLTAQQKVELFKIVTGSDFKEMLDFGAYHFYRLGIGPDGTWHFFVSGD